MQGPTILEMQDPEHAVYRKLHEFAFARSSMKRWDAELVGPLVDSTIAKFKDAKRADLVDKVFMPIPVRVIAALLGLPDSDVLWFHRLAIDLLGFRGDMDCCDGGIGGDEGLLRRDTRGEAQGAAGRHGVDPRLCRSQRRQDVRRADLRFHAQPLPAGAETTSRSTASLAMALLTHPDQLDAVRDDRSLLPQAIEEGIRWETPSAQLHA